MESKCCVKCKQWLGDELQFCWNCGSKNPSYKLQPPQNPIFCPNCNRQVKSHWKFCGHCGISLVKKKKETFVCTVRPENKMSKHPAPIDKMNHYDPFS